MKTNQVLKNGQIKQGVIIQIREFFMRQLHWFYAVTMTSVYFVRDHGNEGFNPVAKKIALRGESEFQVGAILGGGTMIAITKQLQAYVPEGGGLTSFERKIECVNTQYWGECSSYIVALFTTKKNAMACFAHTDLQPCDPRWIEETRRVIKKIGDNHPSFEVCRWEDLALLPS